MNKHLTLNSKPFIIDASFQEKANLSFQKFSMNSIPFLPLPSGLIC